MSHIQKPYVDAQGDEYSIHCLTCEQLELIRDAVALLHSRSHETEEQKRCLLLLHKTFENELHRPTTQNHSDYAKL